MRYQLDPTGISPDNKIIDEVKVITPPTRVTDANFIVPAFTPFFKEGFVIKLGSRVLTEGLDYQLVFRHISASTHFERELFGGIMFIRKQFSGTVKLTYQTLGGEFENSDPDKISEFARTMGAVRWVSLDQIIGVPSNFPPAYHTHDVEADLVNMGDVVDAVEKIAQAIANKNMNPFIEALKRHINNESAHSKAAVGLGNVLNYSAATLDDLRAANPAKYVTSDVLIAWFRGLKPTDFSFGLTTIGDELTSIRTLVSNMSTAMGRLPTSSDLSDLGRAIRDEVDNRFRAYKVDWTAKDVVTAINGIINRNIPDGDTRIQALEAQLATVSTAISTTLPNVSSGIRKALADDLDAKLREINTRIETLLSQINQVSESSSTILEKVKVNVDNITKLNSALDELRAKVNSISSQPNDNSGSSGSSNSNTNHTSGGGGVGNYAFGSGGGTGDGYWQSAQDYVESLSKRARIVLSLDGDSLAGSIMSSSVVLTTYETSEGMTASKHNADTIHVELPSWYRQHLHEVIVTRNGGNVESGWAAARTLALKVPPTSGHGASSRWLLDIDVDVVKKGENRDWRYESPHDSRNRPSLDSRRNSGSSSGYDHGYGGSSGAIDTDSESYRAGYRTGLQHANLGDGSFNVGANALDDNWMAGYNAGKEAGRRSSSSSSSSSSSDTYSSPADDSRRGTYSGATYTDSNKYSGSNRLVAFVIDVGSEVSVTANPYKEDDYRASESLNNVNIRAYGSNDNLDLLTLQSGYADISKPSWLNIHSVPINNTNANKYYLADTPGNPNAFRIVLTPTHGWSSGPASTRTNTGQIIIYDD